MRPSNNFFGSLLLACQRAERWPWVDATVYSYRWNYSPGNEGPSYSSELTYSYRINGELYSGEAKWNDFQGSDVFHQGDIIHIRVDPRHPYRSYLPEKRNIILALYLAIGMVTAIALIFLYVFLSRRAA